MTRPRVLVIGARGQLARALATVGTADCELRLAGRPEFDLTRPETVTHAIRRWQPDVVVNAAGTMDATAAATSPNSTLMLNALGPGRLAEASAAVGAAMIHISTADVFSGCRSGVFSETSPTAPQGAIGASKLLGEELVLSRSARSVVLRTGWLFSPWQTPRTAATTDRIISVCSALDLARVSLWLAPVAMEAPASAPIWGITHCASRGGCCVRDLAPRLAGTGAAPAATALSNADGAGTMMLDCSRLTRIFGHRMPHWEESLREVVSFRPVRSDAIPA